MLHLSCQHVSSRTCTQKAAAQHPPSCWAALPVPRRRPTAASVTAAAATRGLARQGHGPCVDPTPSSGSGCCCSSFSSAPPPKRRRRAHTAAAAGAAPSQQPADASASIRDNVERASRVLEEMVEEVAREMFASEAAAYLSSDPPELQLADAVRSAVASRLEWLDANFLAALNVYVQSAEGAGDGALLELLVALREEVLLQVSRRLPPAVRVLDQVLQQHSAEQRRALLQTALNGGQGELPGADMDALSATCGQFIDDMEDQQVVADRALLARLCLVREDLRQLSAAAGHTNNVLAFHRSNLPRRCAAFLKELLAVGSPQRRLALMEKAFREDWEGAAPSAPPTAPTSASAGADGQPSDVQQEEPVNDFVRPGRFMSTLHAMRSELATDAGTSGAGSGGQQAAGVGNVAAILQRMDLVQDEALTVLQRLQSGGQAPNPVSSVAQ